MPTKTAALPPLPEPIPQGILSDVWSADPGQKLRGLKYIDKYLNRHQQVANRFVIDSGILPLLFDIIRTNDGLKPELLYTAAVCVSFISAGSEDETLIVQAASLINPIYAIFDSKYDEAWDYRIKCQIGLIIGNIAGNSEQNLRRLKEFTTEVESLNNSIKEKSAYIKMQNMQKKQKIQKDGKPQTNADVTSTSSVTSVLIGASAPSCGIGQDIVRPASNDKNDGNPDPDIKLPPAMEYQPYKLSYVRTLIWTMSNFYRYSPRPMHHLQVQEFPLIEYISIFWELIDFEIQRDIAWLLSYIMDEQSMSLIIEKSALIDKIHEYLTPIQTMSNSNYINVLHPILRIYGNFTNGTEEQTNILLEHGFFQLAENLMIRFAAVPKIEREICFIVSNVLVGSPHQRRAVLRSSILRYVVRVLLTAPTEYVRIEAVWALARLLPQEPSLEEVDHLSKQPFSTSSVAYQDKLRYFILESIASVRDEGFPHAAHGMIKQLSDQQHRLLFFS